MIKTMTRKISHWKNSRKIKALRRDFQSKSNLLFDAYQTNANLVAKQLVDFKCQVGTDFTCNLEIDTNTGQLIDRFQIYNPRCMTLILTNPALKSTYMCLCISEGALDAIAGLEAQSNHPDYIKGWEQWQPFHDKYAVLTQNNGGYINV